MFVGVDGIDVINGIIMFNEGYFISGVMVVVVYKVIVVLDVIKFNCCGFNQVLLMDKIDCVIIDDIISKQDKVVLVKIGVELMIV